MLRAQILSSSNVRMAHCKSLIGYFPGRYSCSAAWREIKYSDVLSCLSVWCVSAESLSSQQDVRRGVGHKTALELVHLQQPEEINAFPSRRFTTEPSTRINRVCMLLLLIQKHHILWSQFHKYSHITEHFPQVIFRRETHNPQKMSSHILQLTELCLTGNIFSSGVLHISETKSPE